MKVWIDSDLKGMTRVDVTMLCAGLGLFCLILWITINASITRSRSQRCIANLKTLCLQMNLLAYDDGQNSLRTYRDLGMLPEKYCGLDIFHFFQDFTNNFRDPGLLVCPSDNRNPATKWASLNNSNLSYFVNMDTDKHISSGIMDDFGINLLLGDRWVTNLDYNPQTCLLASRNNPLRWTRSHRGDRRPEGNVAFLDGSVLVLNNKNLTTYCNMLGNQTNRFAVP